MAQSKRMMCRMRETDLCGTELKNDVKDAGD